MRTDKNATADHAARKMDSDPDARFLMVALLAITIIVIQNFVGFVWLLITGVTSEGGFNMPLMVAVASLFSHAICALLIISDTCVDGGTLRHNMGLRPIRGNWPRAAALVLLTLIVIQGFDVVYQHLTQTKLQEDIVDLIRTAGEGSGVLSAGVLYFAIIVTAPVVEEVIFRGYLQTALAERLPAGVAILVSAFAFAAFHFDLQAFPSLFVAGVALGALYHFTRSLWPVMLAHGLINALGVVIVALGITS